MQSSRETESGGREAPEPRAGRTAESDERVLAGGDEASASDAAAEIARLEDRYKRALADLDNYRKRVAREIERQVIDGKQAALLDWLDVVDSVERAMRIESEGPCFEGLRAVLDQMDAVLARQGARRVGEPGDRFDPEQHEAVGVQGRNRQLPRPPGSAG